MKKSKSAIDMINTLKDPDQIFDLVCVNNYFAGSCGRPIPVEDSRKTFEIIKKLLTNPKERG